MSRTSIVVSGVVGFGLGGIAGGFIGRELEKRVGRAALAQDEAALGGAAIGALVGSMLFVAVAASPEEVKVVGAGAPPPPPSPLSSSSSLSDPRFP